MSETIKKEPRTVRFPKDEGRLIYISLVTLGRGQPHDGSIMYNANKEYPNGDLLFGFLNDEQASDGWTRIIGDQNALAHAAAIACPPGGYEKFLALLDEPGTDPNELLALCVKIVPAETPIPTIQ